MVLVVAVVLLQLLWNSATEKIWMIWNKDEIELKMTADGQLSVKR